MSKQNPKATFRKQKPASKTNKYDSASKIWQAKSSKQNPANKV